MDAKETPPPGAKQPLILTLWLNIKSREDSAPTPATQGTNPREKNFTSENSDPRPRVRFQNPTTPGLLIPFSAPGSIRPCISTPIWQESTEAPLTARSVARPSGKEEPRRPEPRSPRTEIHTLLPFLPGTLLVILWKRVRKPSSL